MKTTVKLRLVAIVVAMLFLVIGVDFLPRLFCWMPLVAACAWALNSEEFIEWYSGFFPEL